MLNLGFFVCHDVEYLPIQCIDTMLVLQVRKYGNTSGSEIIGDRVAIWEDDDDDVAERRASEPLVADPLV